jgi:hypothetical protein
MLTQKIGDSVAIVNSGKNKDNHSVVAAIWIEKILNSTKQAVSKTARIAKTAVNSTADFCKDNYKVLGAAALIAAGSYGVGKARAGEIKLSNYGEVSKGVGGSVMYSQNINDANELFDTYDASWSTAPPNPNPQWLKVHSDPYLEELQFDCRPINSITPINEKLSVIGGIVTCSNKIKFDITNYTNLEWQNLIAERYGLEDAGNPLNIKQTWDVKKVSGQYIQLAPLINQPAGIYDQITIKNSIMQI